MSQAEVKDLSCIHCGAPARFGSEEGDAFCCAGCERVYAILHDLNLESFYALRSDEDLKKARPALENQPTFDFLDDPVFHNDYVQQFSADECEISFFIEGVHCAACIWLLEKLSTIHPEVTHSELFFSESRLQVRFEKGAALSGIANSIVSLGYNPKAIREDEFEAEFQKETLSLIIKLGVAAVSAGNCMMIAFSLYEGEFSGIEQRYEKFFILVSAILATPSVFYSASPFYRAAFRGIRRGRLHVDLPISIGVLLGYFLSLFSLVTNTAVVYFDSITILIFLMLAGRVLQRQTLKKAAERRRNLSGLLPQDATVLENGVPKQKYIAGIIPGDVLLLQAGDSVPVDGELLVDKARLDMSVLTGEQEPVEFKKQELLYAGAMCLSSEISLRASSTASTSRFSALMKPNKPQAVSGQTQLLDTISRYFVLGVIILASACFLFWFSFGGLLEALEHTLAFIVVSCPCALGLSAPLLLSKAVSESTKTGVLVSDPSAFESCIRARTVFLDKTGTLSERQSKDLSLLHWQGDAWSSISEIGTESASELFSLESDLTHPLARQLRSYAMAAGGRLLDFRKRAVSREGVEARTQSGKQICVGNKSFLNSHLSDFKPYESLSGGSLVYFKDSAGELYAFEFSEKLRPGALALIELLRKKGKEAFIISGDDAGATERLASMLELEESNAKGELSPEEKGALVLASKEPSIMIGDGANDSLALKSASLGIGVSGGAEQVLRVASVFVISGELTRVADFIKACYRLARTLKGTFIFSVLYNLIAGLAALGGLISPLAAAIIMPISSFTVIAIALLSNPFRKSEV
jgi:cation transport ATPase